MTIRRKSFVFVACLAGALSLVAQSRAADTNQMQGPSLFVAFAHENECGMQALYPSPMLLGSQSGLNAALCTRIYQDEYVSVYYPPTDFAYLVRGQPYEDWQRSAFKVRLLWRFTDKGMKSIGAKYRFVQNTVIIDASRRGFVLEEKRLDDRGALLSSVHSLRRAFPDPHDVSENYVEEKVIDSLKEMQKRLLAIYGEH